MKGARRFRLEASSLLVALLLWLLSTDFAATASGAPRPSILRWGGDAEGGAPFVEADPSAPMTLRGMDVEIAELIARGLGREAQFVQVAYDLLAATRKRLGFDLVSYDDDIHPYTDLAEGRLDAVLLDHIIAQRSLRRVAGSSSGHRRSRLVAMSPQSSGRGQGR